MCVFVFAQVLASEGGHFSPTISPSTTRYSEEYFHTSCLLEAIDRLLVRLDRKLVISQVREAKWDPFFELCLCGFVRVVVQASPVVGITLS